VAKGPEAFRTISEAADIIGVSVNVLRSWEARLPFVKPMRLSGGRRFYRPKDIALLVEVRRLLKEEGLSVDDVRRLRGRRGLMRRGWPPRILALASRRERLEAALIGLLAARERLTAALRRLL
jgi:DNA-binding transcriptional MerR regulator